jgi:hypothetical protein
MSKFRKKPVEIDAFQWTDDVEHQENPVWFVEAIHAGAIKISHSGSVYAYATLGTLEGEMKARPGDWIIRGVKGEIYPCKPDIFAATYEAVD